MLGQTLFSIGSAVVPNLAVKAAMHLLPMLFHAVMCNTGLFDDNKFKL